MVILQPIPVAELELALETEELLQLTNLTDPLATTINYAKAESAIQRATAIINSYSILASRCGQAYLKLSQLQLTIWLSRYLLDTAKSRPFVAEDYERAIKLLEFSNSDAAHNCPLSSQEIADILGEQVNKKRSRSSAGNAAHQPRISRVHPNYI